MKIVSQKNFSKIERLLNYNNNKISIFSKLNKDFKDLILKLLLNYLKFKNFQLQDVQTSMIIQ